MRSSEPPYLERLAFDRLTEPCGKALLSAVFRATADAHALCRREFDGAFAPNVRGFNVGTKLNGLLLEVAERFGHLGRAVKAPGQRWVHAEIVADDLLLTAASTQEPCGPVEPAYYKAEHAKQAQQSLFGEAEGAYNYAILTYSRYLGLPEEVRLFGHLPGSAYLVFPSVGFDSYLHVVNLMERYPAVVERHVPQDWGDERFQAYLRRARRMSGFEGGVAEA